MKLNLLSQTFSVCKLSDLSQADLACEFCFTAQTDEETSLVCPTTAVPESCLEREDGWKAFRIEGVLDFSLIGILSGISKVLADAQIGLFVISTFNTDYILVKEETLAHAADALKSAGYTVAD